MNRKKLTTEVTFLSLTFTNRQQALGIARTLSGNPLVEEFPADGSLGEDTYYNIIDIGQVIDPSTNEPVPGYHLLGAWRGPPSSVPAPVWAAHVADRPDWWPKLG
jgi:hypothetical protein